MHQLRQLFVVGEAHLNAYKKIGLEPEVAQAFAEYNNEDTIRDVINKRVLRSSWWNFLEITLSAGIMFQEYMMTDKPLWHHITYYVIGGLIALHGIYNWISACVGQANLVGNIHSDNLQNREDRLREVPSSAVNALKKLGLEPIVGYSFFERAPREQIINVSTRLWMKQCASSLLYFCMGANFFVQELGPFDKFPLWHEITFYTLTGLLAIGSLYNAISTYVAHDKILELTKEKVTPIALRFTEHPPEHQPQPPNWVVTMRK